MLYIHKYLVHECRPKIYSYLSEEALVLRRLSDPLKFYMRRFNTDIITNYKYSHVVSQYKYFVF